MRHPRGSIPFTQSDASGKVWGKVQQIEKVQGAIKGINTPMTAPFPIRMQHNRDAKAKIAARVCDMIPDGASVAIDAGSTGGFVVQALQIRRQLTALTNSAFVASTLSLIECNRVHFAGTFLRDYDGAAYDRSAFETVSRMHVDFCVLTVAQVHAARGFLVADQNEADMALAAISEQVIFAVDHSKFMGEASWPVVAQPIARAADPDHRSGSKRGFSGAQ